VPDSTESDEIDVFAPKERRVNRSPVGLLYERIWQPVVMSVRSVAVVRSVLALPDGKR